MKDRERLTRYMNISVPSCKEAPPVGASDFFPPLGEKAGMRGSPGTQNVPFPNAHRVCPLTPTLSPDPDSAAGFVAASGGEGVRRLPLPGLARVGYL